MRAIFSVARRVAHVYLKVNLASLNYRPPETRAKGSDPNVGQRLEDAQRRIRELEEAQDREIRQADRKKPDDQILEGRTKRVLETLHHVPETEAETRLVIDRQLREAGWEADTDAINHAAGVRPEAKRNIAIAEWPFDGSPADYALFAGVKLVGIIEAKKARKDIPGSIEQAKRYAALIGESDDYELAVPASRKLKAPFLFATNGRPYLEQFQQKSGIWFLDTRENDNHPRALTAFHSPNGLLNLLKQDVAAGDAALAQEPFDYLTDRRGLSLRDYQVRVISAAEGAVRTGKRNALIVMATGTGKTRTAVGLVYRLLKTARFKRILFLVDRTALGEQAGDMFKDAKIEGLLTFTQIYEIMELEDRKPDPATRVHFATVQGMIRRLFFEEPENRLPWTLTTASS